MKSLITMMLLAAAFVGGYHLGHLPGSPDIKGFEHDVYAQVQKAMSSISQPDANQPAAPAPEQARSVQPGPQVAQAVVLQVHPSQAAVAVRSPVTTPTAVVEIGGKLYQVGVQVQ